MRIDTALGGVYLCGYENIQSRRDAQLDYFNVWGYWIYTAKRRFVNNKKTQIYKKKFYKYLFIAAIFWSNLLFACKYRSFGEVSNFIDYQDDTDNGRLYSIILPVFLHEITAFFAVINMQ